MSATAHPVLFRTDQVAEIIHVQPQTLSAWRRRGGGPPYIRLSKIRVVYPASGLERWLAERTATSTAEEFQREVGR